jgi:hypothetical protein
MKMLATAFCVLGGGMLFSTAAQRTSTTPERPKFKIEIRATGEKGQGPRFAVTNLTAKTVTACVFEQSYPSQGARIVLRGIRRSGMDRSLVPGQGRSASQPVPTPAWRIWELEVGQLPAGQTAKAQSDYRVQLLPKRGS